MVTNHKKIRLSKSSLGKEEKSAVLKVLEREYLGMGTETKAFEYEISKFLGLRPENVCCVSSGTAALHLALEALDLEPHDEVLVPSITYVASLQSISASGAKPVLVDVMEDNLLMDPVILEKKISKRSKAIMYVHYASNPSQTKAIYKIAKKYKLRLIEDAAHSFGCREGNKLVGTSGDIVCFSFDGIKNITSGEGGVIVSKDKDLIKRTNNARLLGVENDTESRFNRKRSWLFNVKHRGFRYHMSDIMAAIGRAQLKKVNKFGVKRRKLYNRYKNKLKSSEIRFLDYGTSSFENIIPHICVIKVPASSRDFLREYLSENSVETGLHWYPNHLLSLYHSDEEFFISEKVFSEIISLPLHVDLTLKDVDHISRLIEKFFNA